MIENILVITDQDEDKKVALEKAREVAAPFNANILVLAFVEPNSTKSTASAIESHKEKLYHNAHEILDFCTWLKSDVIVTDDIATMVLAACKDNAIDLVIKTGHRSETFFYTPLDWQLIRSLSCPILIASEEKWRSKPNVLATVDVDTHSEKQLFLNEDVLILAKEWASATDDMLSICFTAPIPLSDLDLISELEYERKIKPKASHQINKLLEDLSIKSDKIHIKVGPPQKLIPKIANSIQANLVVVGTVGRTGINGALLGNTAEKVLQSLRTDILVVPPKKRQKK